jgi:hypothetical protein
MSVETILNQLKINRLNKSQYDSAESLNNNELYLVDPQFNGNKLLKTDSSGNIVESDIAPSDMPGVIDNTTSTSVTDALSANQGRVLQEQIDQLKALGRFLSNWNSTTGLPATNPPGYDVGDTYTYKVGDYYLIGNIASAGGTNYKPNGSSYVVGTASTTVETEEVHAGDMYIYDSAQWLLLHTEEIKPIKWIFY